MPAAGYGFRPGGSGWVWVGICRAKLSRVNNADPYSVAYVRTGTRSKLVPTTRRTVSRGNGSECNHTDECISCATQWRLLDDNMTEAVAEQTARYSSLKDSVHWRSGKVAAGRRSDNSDNLM